MLHYGRYWSPLTSDALAEKIHAQWRVTVSISRCGGTYYRCQYHRYEKGLSQISL